MQLRFKPGNMIMHDAVPFGQPWTYYSDHPIETMMDTEYLKPHVSFRAGDSLRILQTDQRHEKVLELAELMVSSTNPLELFVTRPKTSMRRKKPGPKPTKEPVDAQ